jgi:hypothetical protein
MPTIDQATFPDEDPTKKTDDLPGRTLVLAARIDRLVQLAIERLMACPGDRELSAAVASLQEVRALTAAVLR